MIDFLFVTYGVITWLVIAGILFLIEGLTVELVSMWFGFGALIAMASSALGAPAWIQLLVFLLSSVAVLVFGRPVLMERVKVKKQPTNADMVIGQAGVVITDIDNIAQTGRIIVNGLDWSARSYYGQPIPTGAKVLVHKIDGVKLIVEPIEPVDSAPAAPEESEKSSD